MKRNGLIVLLVAFAAGIACSRSCWAVAGKPARTARLKAASLASVPARHAESQRQAGRSARRRLAGAGNRHGEPATRRSASWACRPRGSTRSRSWASAAAITPAASTATRRATARASCPDSPFDAGERVIVRAVIGAGGSRSSDAADPGGRRQADRLSTSASILHIRRRALRRSETHRRRPPTIRASTRCPASRPRS